MIAVAPVTTLTSADQLLKGPSANIPDGGPDEDGQTRTPFAFVRVSRARHLAFFAESIQRRAVVPT